MNKISFASENIDKDEVIQKLRLEIKQRIRKHLKQGKKEIVIVCIGTDRSTGDALGPLVGDYLFASRSKLDFVSYYGTIENPVHATNMEKIFEEIKQKHQNALVIAIDACLGQADSLGKIFVEDGALRPGAGVNKVLPEIGDFSITGIVNVGGFMEYFVLQNTKLSVVIRMVNIIGPALIKALTDVKRSFSKKQKISEACN